jgi:hypothetical protein
MARHLASYINCAYMYVLGGTGRTLRIRILLKCCSSDVPTLYVRPMEKHEYDILTSTCTMSYNVLL